MKRTVTLLSPLLLTLSACDTDRTPREMSDEGASLSSPDPEPEPRFTTPCAGTGYSRELSPTGLPVRDAPNAHGRVLGRIYNIVGPDEPVSPHESMPSIIAQPSFRIIDVAGDWTRIEGADPVSEDGDVRKENFTGSGWIPTAMVGYSVSGPARPGRTDYAYAAPDFAAQVIDELGTLNILHVPSEPTMIACRGSWIELRYRRRLPETSNALPPRDPYGDGPWVTGWIKVEPYVTYQTR